jgi:flagellar basal-body rod modification protein FlgD
MATTDPLTGSSAADALTSSPNQITRTTGATLGKDDFLKLLVGQMKNMDPLSQSGKDPSESMGQMTQFSMLEQLQNMNKSNEALAQQTKVSSTIGLIGHNVTYSDEAGAPVEGTVEKVETAGDKVTLTVGGKPGIDPDNVIEVR